MSMVMLLDVLVIGIIGTIFDVKTAPLYSVPTAIFANVLTSEQS